MKAVYDFEHWQPSYTIVNFLMTAEHERIKRGDEFIDIAFLPGTRKYKYWPSEPHEVEQCMEGIVRPMVKMLPSVRNVDYLERRIEIDDAWTLGHKFQQNTYVAAYAAGVRPLRVPYKVERLSNIVTMTFRECGDRHWKQRDTNVDEWLKAAAKLTQYGHKVFIVRDTSKANEGLKGFTTNPAASLFLKERADQYLSSYVNLFVSNGPAWFALALDVSAVIFRPATDGANKAASLESQRMAGIVPGEQMQGAPSHQKLIWEPDTAENIVEAVMNF